MVTYMIAEQSMGKGKEKGPYYLLSRSNGVLLLCSPYHTYLQRVSKRAVFHGLVAAYNCLYLGQRKNQKIKTKRKRKYTPYHMSRSN